MTPVLRQRVLLGLLGLSLLATAWVASREEPPLPAPPKRMARTPAAKTPDLPAWPHAITAPRQPWPEADVHARLAWGDAAVPLAPAPQVVTGPAAEDGTTAAPTFDYQLVGRMTDSRARAVLTNAQRSLVVDVGDVIDGQWRVEAIEPGGLRLRHLSSGTPPQLIAFSAT